MRVIDLGPISYLAKEHGLALLVDATSPARNYRPLEHGADVVITSATKYLNGHSDVIAGVVAGSSAFVEEVNRLMRLWGQAIDPHAAWLIDRGMRTLAVRMERHNANGMAVAQWAEQHPGIAKVHYPGLPSPPDHAHATVALNGFGGWWGSSSRAAPRRRRGCSNDASCHPRTEPGRGRRRHLGASLTSAQEHRPGGRPRSVSRTASCV